MTYTKHERREVSFHTTGFHFHQHHRHNPILHTIEETPFDVSSLTLNLPSWNGKCCDKDQYLLAQGKLCTLLFNKYSLASSAVAELYMDFSADRNIGK